MTSGYKLNTEKTVAVSTDTYFNMDMKLCPRGVKLQLLGAGKVAVYGTYTGDPFWIGWCAAPKVPHESATVTPKASVEDFELLSKELESMGYDLDELEKDSPYYTNPYA